MDGVSDGVPREAPSCPLLCLPKLIKVAKRTPLRQKRLNKSKRSESSFFIFADIWHSVVKKVSADTFSLLLHRERTASASLRSLFRGHPSAVSVAPQCVDSHVRCYSYSSLWCGGRRAQGLSPIPVGWGRAETAKRARRAARSSSRPGK